LSIHRRPSPFSPLGGSLSTPAGRPDGDGRRTTAQPGIHGLPREARGRQKRLLVAHVGFPNRGLRLQPAAPGRPSRAPSGTKLGTKRSSEVPNRNRIRSLEGRRPRIGYPVLLRRRLKIRVLSLRWAIKDQKSSSPREGRPQSFHVEILLRKPRLPRSQEDQLEN